MGISIGECKENYKPEEYLTVEYQGRKHNTRDRFRGRLELSIGEWK